ncbi:MAG: hypothetical protein QXT26_05985 [Thermoproteota archaeon]
METKAYSIVPVVVLVELGSNTPRFPDFKRKRWAEREFKTTVWTANELELDLNLTGKPGSKTDVIELQSIAPPQRLRKFLEGSEEEKASAIIKIIQELKGQFGISPNILQRTSLNLHPPSK